MSKLARALRLFIVAASMGAGILLPAAPASASTYTMQDYYTTLAAIDADSLMAGDLQNQVYYLQQNINWLNEWYYVQYNYYCSAGQGGQPRSIDARDECMASTWAEWWFTVTPMEYELAGLQMSLAGALAQLNANLQLLAVIKVDLGIP